MNDTSPYISLFIPTYNDLTDLVPCLESLRHLNYPKNKAEIVIWDNASTDDTVEMVRRQYSEMKKDGWLQLKLIEWKKNEGSYIPYNLVRDHLAPESKYILGIDADVELSENVLIDLINAAQEDRVAAVGGRSVYYDNPSRTSHGAGFVNRWTGFYGEKDSEEGMECDYVIGCCWLLNRNIFNLLGGFDPDYYITHWEVDYCLRAKRRGYRILYEPGAIARHKIPLHGTLNPVRIYYVYRNKIKLIKKTFSTTRKWVALLLHFTFGLSKAVAESFVRNRSFRKVEIKLILKAFYDGYLNKSGKVF